MDIQDDADEVTWQTYKGQLTEKQEKTRDKIIKRTEKASVFHHCNLFLLRELCDSINIQFFLLAKIHLVHVMLS